MEISRLLRHRLPRGITAVACILGIAVLSLWPFDFDFGLNRNHVEWRLDGSGVMFRKPGQLLSHIPPKQFHERITTGSGLSVEAWIRSYHSAQSGPARIISYSLDPLHRNFTLAQSGDALVMRLRTTKTDLNGMNPHFEAPRVFHATDQPGRIQHVVLTYDCRKACAFIDGREHHCDSSIGGDFLDWAPDHHLVIGNEVTADRPWLGEIHAAAIYSRALTQEEIRHAYNRGLPGSSPGAGWLEDHDRLVAYRFDTPGAVKVANVARSDIPVHLDIPKSLPPFPFDLSGRSAMREFMPANLIPNLAAFIPIGFLLLGFFQQYGPSRPRAIPAALAAGLLIAFGIEYLQHYLPARHSSWPELLMKSTGIIFGMALQTAVAGHRRPQRTPR